MSESTMNVPHSVPCVKKGQSEKLCWLSAMANGEITNGEFNIAVQEDILICSECATFKEIISRGFGRRNADQALASTIAKLISQLADRNFSLEETRKSLEQKSQELTLMKVITDAVVKTTDLSKALKIILTGVTSGRAFGFNRAGIFLVDERNQYLDGKDAVGPENREVAIKIWNELKSLSFEEQISEILEATVLQEDFLHKLIVATQIPLSDNSNIFVQALWAEKPTYFRRSDLSPDLASGILKHLDFNEFVAVPLQSDGPPRGLMIADNYYTNKPITAASIDALETLANTCTNVLEVTLLHEQLSNRLSELERVNRLLRENQNYLTQAERLADIGKLGATVAHEFKTPLITIGGYARRALRDYDTPKFRKRDLEIIAAEVERLEEITSEILEYSRQSKLNIKPVGINEVVKDALDFLEYKLTAADIKLKTKYDSANPIAAVDGKRIRQAIFNIVDNSIDSMQPGMSLRVSTGTCDDFVNIDIIDTGTGIPDDVREKLFTLFFTTKPRGSGLGLPVSKKIIEDHGGRIEFDSKADLETRFSIYLPRVNKSENK